MKVLQRLIFRARKTFAREVAAGAGTSVLESEAAQQQVADRSGGQCADSDRGASGDRGARRCRDAITQRHWAREGQHRPTPLHGFLSQAAVGVDHRGVADGLEHGQIGDRVGVGVAVFQRIALTGGQLANRLNLAFAVAIEGDLAGVLTVRHDHPGRHRVGGAQRAGDRAHNLLAGGGDHHDVTSTQFVAGYEVCGFGEHQRRHDVVQRLVDYRLHLFRVPAGAHVGHVGAHPVHLVMVGAGKQKDELRIAGFEHGSSVHQALREERFAERQRAGFGDDRLVQVEKRRGAGARRRLFW